MAIRSGDPPRPAQRLPAKQRAPERKECLVDVGPLVIPHAQAAKLTQPGKCALHDPPPPAEATPMLGYGAWPARAQCGDSGDRAEWRPRRSRDPRPHGSVAAAVAPVDHAAGESHPPTPGLLASRSGSRRSSALRAVRRARHKSDGACSRAWPNRWDSDRFGHRRTPRGCNNCPRPRATNQSGHRARANPAAQSGSDPIRQPVASPASDASTSFLIRTRVPGEASAKGCRYEGRRQYQSDTRVPRRAVDHPVAVVEDSARTARQDPTTDLVAAWRSSLFTLPRRENNVSGFCYTL